MALQTQSLDSWARRGSLVLVLSCAGLLLLTSLAVAGLLPGRAAPISLSTGYRVGSYVDVPVSWFEGSRRNVLFFVRTDCAVSARAAAFIAQVRERFATGDVAVRLAMPGARPDAEAEFARSAGFSQGEVGSADFVALNLAAVPAMVVVDNRGMVLWEGMAAADPERGAEQLVHLSTVVGD